MLKKGAMFGLDARIALAIFGALSVISGAALYSAIQDSRVVAFWQDTQELIKAAEQYYLDNGKIMPLVNSNESSIGDLINNRESLSTWKGPYIGQAFSWHTQNKLTYKIGGISTSVQFDFRKTDTVLNTDYCASNSNDCYLWVEYHCSSSADHVNTCVPLFTALDEKVDDGDGFADGIIRAFQDSSTAHFYLIRAIPAKKP